MARELDVRGLHCPLPILRLPILRTRRQLDHMAEGEELIVLVTDPASVIDFRHFCNTTAHELVEHTQAEGVFTYRIRRGAA
jgi:tRNA 2-thiouridine synthesizing protein A